jgi:phosphatidylglycerophosphatase C
MRRHPRRWWRLLPCAAPLLRYACGQRDRGVLKGAIIRWTLGGVPRPVLAAWSAEFSARLLRAGLYAEALTCITAHQRAQAHLVLLSASPDLYVPVLAKALGFDECACSQLRWRGDDSLEGTLISPNRRGTEKTRYVKALLAERKPRYSHAYGNSPADLEHLRLVSAGTYVNGSASDLTGMPNVRAVRWHHRAQAQDTSALR